MNKYAKEQAAIIAQAAINAGYRAFIAESGHYGFYTDAKGSRIVSFQCDGFHDSISGNYKTSNPAKTGTGWRISDDFSKDNLVAYFEQFPPRWATGDATWEYTTLDQHQDTYQASSKYSEVTA